MGYGYDGEEKVKIHVYSIIMSSLKELHANSNLEDFAAFKAAAEKAPEGSELHNAFKAEGASGNSNKTKTKADGRVQREEANKLEKKQTS